MLILTLFFILLGKPIFCQETPQLKLRRFETRNLQTSKLKMDFLVAHINMIKKKFFSGGFAPELFMVLSNVCAKFESFLYFKIFCKIILKF